MSTKNSRTRRVPHTPEGLVERFQCPGCVVGSDTQCGSYKPETPMPDVHTCVAHIPGTTMVGRGKIETFAWGLPHGFDQFAPRDPSRNRLVQIRLHPNKPPADYWTPFDRPIWASVQDGFLFVRTYSPRIDRGYTDVFEGGTLEDLPPGVPTFEDEEERVRQG